MKKSLLLAGLLALGMTAFAQNPYAYNASTGEAGALDLPVTYTLNAAAERVVVDFIDVDGTVAKSVELEAENLTAGEHTAVVSFEGLEANATYSVAIRVKGAEIDAPVQCDPVYTFWSPYGIAVDNDPLSKHFGRILVTECQPSVNAKGPETAYWTSVQAEGGVGVGLYVFDPQLNKVQNEEGNYGYAVPWTQEAFNYQEWGGANAGNFALKKVKISEDGRIFVGGLDVKNGQPLYEVNPDNLAEWTPIFVGEKSKLEETGYDHRLYDAEGNFVGGYSAALAVTGKGEDLRIMNLSATRGQVFTYGNYQTFEYPLGTATTWDVAAAEENECMPLSMNYTISAQSVSIDYDPNGNLWWSQYRGSPSEEQPTMKHASKNIDGEWEEDYSFITSEEFPFNRGGGIAVSPDGNKLAVSTGNFKLTVYDVAYNEAGVPTLSNPVTCTSTDVRGFNDIAWDCAGNLYGCDNGMETFRCFQFPRTAAAPAGAPKRALATQTDDPLEVCTPLREEFNFTVPPFTGVNSVNANKAIAGVQYINAAGQVSNVPFEGLNIVVTKYQDGTQNVVKVVK